MSHDDRNLLPPGTRVGPCRIERLIGRGGMGDVYLAEHLALQRHVAVKVLRPALCDALGIERFLKEARMASRVDHQNVITIFDVGSEKGLHYIVMQYVKGRNLSELLTAQKGPLPWISALKLIRLAAKGLEAVHRAGLIHRDIKPQNIMLSDDSRVFLMDFGLVREESGSDLTLAGELVGTAAFMSREQCQGRKLDRRSDIYSLGATLYTLLVGRPPFQGGILEVVNLVGSGTRPPPAHTINSRIPREVSDVVARAMSPQPLERPDDAATFARELGGLLRNAQLADTESWASSIAHGTLVELQSDPVLAPELAPLELLPIGSTWETVREHSGWIIGAGVLVTILIVAVILNIFLQRPAGVDAAGKPATSDGTGSDARDSATGKVPVTVGMVKIEAGWVELGNDAEKVRDFLKQHMPNQEQRESLVKITIEQEPARRVEIPAFWIDRYEVTNADYARFINESKRNPPPHWGGSAPKSEIADHPVTLVTYDDAEAYATWAGKKLPTREQWLRAYRGDKDWLLPWGDTYDGARANVFDNPLYARATSPVTATPKDISRDGVFNLVGNVGEFIRGTVLIQGQTSRAAKGAGFDLAGYAFGIAPMQYRYGLNTSDKALGFRCVVEVPQE